MTDCTIPLAAGAARSASRSHVVTGTREELRMRPRRDQYRA